MARQEYPRESAVQAQQPSAGDPFGSLSSGIDYSLSFDSSEAGLENFDFDSFLHVDNAAESFGEFDFKPPPPAESKPRIGTPSGLFGNMAFGQGLNQAPGKDSNLPPPLPTIGHGSSSVFGSRSVSSQQPTLWSPSGVAQKANVFGSAAAFGAAASTGAQTSGIFGGSLFQQPFHPAPNATANAGPSVAVNNDGAALGAYQAQLRATGQDHETRSGFDSNNQLLPLLIGLQTFEGSWLWTSELFAAINVPEERAEDERLKQGLEKEAWATALVIIVFEERLKDKRGSWELVVEKAKGWLASKTSGQEKNVMGGAKKFLDDCSGGR